MRAAIRRRVLLDAGNLVGALVISAIVTDAAGAAARADVDAAGINVDLNVAALVLALGTLLAGLVAYGRLKSERPKIVQEVGEIAERRLKAALEASWTEVDRCRRELADTRAREEWLEARVDVLEASLRAAGYPIPPAPPPPASAS